MKKIVLFLIASPLVFLHVNTKAQSFVNGGNNLTATGRLGTTSNQSLAFITNNSERGRVNTSGNWGFGTSSPTERVHINSASGASALRVQVNGSTKLFVHSGGGVAIGSSATPPTNGLYVSGNVGIGTSPAYKLHILTANLITAYHGNTFAGSEDHTGTYSYSVNAGGWGYGSQSYGGYYGSFNLGQGGNYTGSVHGVYGAANGVSGSCFGYRYGVEGFATGGTNNYGVYGSASDACGSANFVAAGYFAGDVYANNYFYISDRKFKKDITPLKNAMQQLMKLKPSAYTFKTTEYPNMALTAGNQLGLIADEVKQVFPELVKQTVSPAQYDKDKVLVTPSEKYESVNYIGLVPVLIASVQEQQSTIAALKADNEDLKARLTKLEQAIHLNNDVSLATPSAASISQNSPNPFSGNTIINYYLPEQSKSAFVNISDINGRIIKRVQLTQHGNGQLTLPASQFTTGSYQYSLLVDGRIVDTKKMVLRGK